MNKFILTVKKPVIKPNIPIEAETICPDLFAGKSIKGIEQLPIWRGNKEIALKEIFDFQGSSMKGKTAEEIEIELVGDLSRFKRIGEKMSGGVITIKGSSGMHLGFQMKGGKIIVEGNAGDFAGANMKGGELIIKGNAGHYLGGSARGDWRGMTGGKIIVNGNVGNECGIWMRKGLIEIGGIARLFLGMHMHRGTIIVNGDVEARAGAEMTGGTIVIRGTLKKNLPSFEFIKRHESIEIEEIGSIKGPFLEFQGDFAERSQGALFVIEEKNRHLLDNL